MSPSDYFQPFVDWADGFGLMGLALVSASEAAFQPIPPDVLVIPMVIEADSILGISLIVLVATLSSVLGAFFGYGIGYYGGIPLLERFVSDSNVNRLNFLIEKYGSAGVFIAAISPIPYKALAWIAGAGRMDLRLFALAGIFGRGIRFGSVGFLLGVYGESVQSSLNWFNFTLISIFCIIFFIPLMRWWNSIDTEGKHEA
ncbi:MAG: VTT domain-containing protein [Candidatus Thalassarchaeaceae archaeon]|nr:VTT domain-containing protein [Candidatus Thalassarchaeaceae archaeon]|tara:strand:+ start:671 stop:1270 length:600 start_codon:yes stop_codon:yes gene_type:complete